MRPFIHVNCAMSADGKIAGEDRTQVRISSDEDKARVKNLRKKYDAILVGVGTILADDPHLTFKDGTYDTNPIRIVLDPHGKTPDEALVLDERAPTIMVTLEGCDREWDCEETIRAGKDTIDLESLMSTLAEDIGVESILVEGGGRTISSFFRSKMVDRYTVFVGGLIIGGSDSPTPCDGNGWAAENGIKMDLKACDVLGNGALLTFEPKFRSLFRGRQHEFAIVGALAENLFRLHLISFAGGVLQDF
jgi:2,5-diamino-6-(ribosylamino)-4(3H)-pyrimidinone 5'-phosphate reductase